MPTRLLTMVLLITIGLFPAGNVKLMARQGLSTKTLLAMSGDEPFTKLTTPERYWLSAVLLRNKFCSMIGEAPFPPMPAPNPPPPCALFWKTLLTIVGDEPKAMI